MSSQNQASETLQGVSADAAPTSIEAGEAAQLASNEAAVAEIGVATKPIKPIGSTMPGIDMTQYAMVCLGLVAVILGLGWGVKRFLAGNLRMGAQKRAMKVVDMLPLGGKRQLAVVRCYDRTFLLGLGEREVNLVTELDSDEDVEGSLAARKQPKAQTASFNKLFQRAVKEAGPEAVLPTATGDSEEAPSTLGAGLLG